LIDKEAVTGFLEAIKAVQLEGGKLITGGDVLKEGGFSNGN